MRKLLRDTAEMQAVSGVQWNQPKSVLRQVVMPSADIEDTGRRLVFIVAAHLGSHFSYAATMVEMAKRDFPSLDPNSVVVRLIHGITPMHGHIAIEFYVDADSPALSAYKVIDKPYPYR